VDAARIGRGFIGRNQNATFAAAIEGECERGTQGVGELRILLVPEAVDERKTAHLGRDPGDEEHAAQRGAEERDASRRADQRQHAPCDLDERDDREGLGGGRMLGMGANGAGMDGAGADGCGTGDQQRPAHLAHGLRRRRADRSERNFNGGHSGLLAV